MNLSLLHFLFAHREVSLECNGFSPFELYDHTIRGPLLVLKDLWSGETLQPVVRSADDSVPLPAAAISERSVVAEPSAR